MQEGTCDFLCNFFILFTEGWKHACSLRILSLCAISWLNVQVWLILLLVGLVVPESGERVCYICQHRLEQFSVVLVRIGIHS